MQSRPAFGLPVANLQRSIRFYRDQVGLEIDNDTTSPGTALLTTPRGNQILVAGPDAPPWDDILDDPYTVHPQNDKIFISDPEFDERLERLSGIDRSRYELIEREWGDRMLEIPDPDGYILVLSSIRERSRAEIVELLRWGQRDLRRLSEGLSDAELSLRPDDSSWSVREVIHHVADIEITVQHIVRVALANSGIEYRSNPPDLNHYARELRYQERNIETSLRQVDVIRDQLMELVELVPDAWERSIRSSTGTETTVENNLHMLATHTLEHLAQINDVRVAIGKSPISLITGD